MGNRAVITTCDKEIKFENYKDNVGIYLHWNGGRDSVNAFLTYCKFQGFRQPEIDDYGWARLSQIIGNFFGGGDSIGVNVCKCLDCDNYDNGVYIIKNWQIVGRDFYEGAEQNCYDLYEMLCDIDKNQPLKMQLGAEKIKSLLEKEDN